MLVLDSLPLIATARRCSTAPAKAVNTKVGCHLIGAGTASLGIYAYLNSVTPAVQVVKLKEISPSNPANFVDFELKEPFH
jgi:hypothetical protein